jgi:DNA-binding NarL/FixJ family response regulator
LQSEADKAMIEKTIRVCVIAAFEPLRLGLVKTLASAPDLEIVGEATALSDLATNPNIRDADVFVVDVDVLARGTGGTAISNLNEWLPALKVLFLGNQEDARVISPDDLPLYMKLNTVGFLFREGSTLRLVQAVRLISQGTFVCEADVIKGILVRLMQWASMADTTQTDYNLTEREMAVLTRIAQGASNKEIAQETFLSEGTVKAHVSHIMQKLRIDRRTDLVRFAIGKGLVALNEEAAR